MKYTFVRDNFYSELIARLADDEGVICGPAEQGRVACVAQRDVAQAVANIMADIAAGGTQHQGRTYTLTGSQALSMEDVARILTTCTGRPHRFHNETMTEAFASRRAAYPDTPDWENAAWVSTYTAIAKGELAQVTQDLPRLIGREPLTFEQVVTEMANSPAAVSAPRDSGKP